ncbi:MAG: PorT family protein [Bacteroidales bacterium]|nr:PorT family protein [Bacteroidales bacterium]
MKLRIILLGLLFSIKVFGDSDTSKFGFGVKSGFGSCFFSDIDKYELQGFSKSALLILNIGFSASYDLNKSFSLGAEVLYDARGGSYQKENEDVRVVNLSSNKSEKAYFSNDYRIQSIDLPVYLKLTTQILGISTFIYVGMSPSVTLKSKYKYNTWDTSDYFAEETWHSETYDNLKGTFSIAYLGGLGLNVKRISYEIRYANFLRNELMIDRESMFINNHSIVLLFSFNFL